VEIRAYIIANKEICLLAAVAAGAILTALYFQLFAWRWNSKSIDLSLLLTLTFGIASAFVLPGLLPRAPFSWLQWLADNGPGECSPGCWEADLMFFSAALITGLAIAAACIVTLWGPWWLSAWRRRYREKFVLAAPPVDAQQSRAPTRADTVPFIHVSDVQLRRLRMFNELDELISSGMLDEDFREHPERLPQRSSMQH